MSVGAGVNAAPGRRLRAATVHVAVWAAFASLVVVTEIGEAGGAFRAWLTLDGRRQGGRP